MADLIGGAQYVSPTEPLRLSYDETGLTDVRFVVSAAGGLSITSVSGEPLVIGHGLEVVGATELDDDLTVAGQSHFQDTVGIGTSPLATALLAFGAGAASYAPLKFTAGVLKTTPLDGAVEYDGADFYVTIGSTRTALSKVGHTHTWSEVSKSGSSLADLATRSAGDLSSGNLAYAQMPNIAGTWAVGGALSITGGNVTLGSNLIASGVGPHAFGGTTSTRVQYFFQGTFIAGAGGTAYGLRYAGNITPFNANEGVGLSFVGGFTTNSGVAHGKVTSARFERPILTLVGGGSFSEATTVYIDGAPTTGLTNYALHIAGGPSLISGTTTMDGDMLFTDATFDIGKSGATRPRDGFFSRNFTVGGIQYMGTTVTTNATSGDIVLQKAHYLRSVASTDTFKLIRGDDNDQVLGNGPLGGEASYSVYLGETAISTHVGMNLKVRGMINVGPSTAAPLTSAGIVMNLYHATVPIIAFQAGSAYSYLSSTSTYLQWASGNGTTGIKIKVNLNAPDDAFVIETTTSAFKTHLTAGTDATYDLGTNATTARFRDFFLSRNALIGGTLTVVGTTTLATALTGLLRADSGVISVSAGVGTRSIFDHFADANNSGTAETDLYSDTLAAGRLAANGEKVTAQYGVQLSGAATATQQVRVYFGGTLVFDSGALSIGAATTDYMDLYVTVIRVSSTVVRVVVSATSNFATLNATANYVEITGLTLSNTQVLKITGTAAGVGGASNQITAKEGYVEWLPAAA